MKKDYAHAMGLLANSSDKRERLKAWVAKQENPYPILVSGFFSSSLVINKLELECGIDRQSLLVYHADRPDSFSAGKRIEEKMESQATPVSIFTSRHFVFPSDFSIPLDKHASPEVKTVYGDYFAECQKLAEDAQALRKLGSNVFLLASPKKYSAHTCPVIDGKGHSVGEGWDTGLFHISEKPFDAQQPEARMFGTNAPRLWPDAEGSIIFLAYLLNKGYVTERDIPAGRADVPFGQQMLGRAQSSAYQDKIKALAL